MSVLFRVDSGHHIGSGHVMRCLSIAEILRSHNVNVYFASKQHPGHCIDLIDKKGFMVLPIDQNEINEPSESANWCPHASWLRGTEEEDANEVLTLLREASSVKAIDWVVVDHFSLTEKWHRLIKQSLDAKVMIIDGLSDRKVDSDILLDPNLVNDVDKKWSHHIPAYAETFVGPQFFPLREEFSELETKVRIGKVSNLLICFGGVDKDNMTTKACRATQRWLDQRHINCDVNVVIGVTHPFKQQIERMCHQYGFKCWVQTDQMAKLMADADLAIGAAGTMAWERCKLGLPSIMTVIADNQAEQALSLAKRNAAILLGAIRDTTESDIFASLQALDEAPNRISTMSANAMQIMAGASVEPSWVKKLI